jgi:5'-methylthioadenosine phosphorylase
MKPKTYEKIAIIGGTGYEDFSVVKKWELKTVRTRYGRIQAKIGTLYDKEILFLARHGFGYAHAPPQISYHANVAALKKEKVTSIIATSAVGSMNPEMRPGEFVLISDFIDFTKHRKQTFHEEKPVYTDVSGAYSLHLREKIIKAAEFLRIKLHPEAVYVCTEGPRFETPAEIRMFQKLGGDVVGMTCVPEVVLAAEAGIPYAALALVTNMAAGITKGRLTAEEVFEMMDRKQGTITKIFGKFIEIL